MNKMPRVAAIHDMSGFGRCSMTVVLPTLGAMGAWCCPLQTAVLSANTAFPATENAVFLDLTPQMERTMAHWQELGATFDGIYSGFLGSGAQIDLLRRFIKEFKNPNTLVVVDPVMGDHGAPYRTYTPELCRRMAELAAEAQLVTPNLTEAAILLGETYDDHPAKEKLQEWLKRLSLDGRRSVVLTGAKTGDGMVGAGCFDSQDGTSSFHMAEEVPGRFSGTGDLFTSVVTGSLLRGDRLSTACDRAVQFVAKCAKETIRQGGNPAEGAMFEQFLGELANCVK
ncbi:MAG: pyridoxamine kinase [Oscillospiraceae bacterium]